MIKTEYEIISQYVSRETFEKIELFILHLIKWNKKINLIGRNEIDKIWERHIFDCIELINFINSKYSSKKAVDFGSGSGLPGIIMGIASNLENIHLIESCNK